MQPRILAAAACLVAHPALAGGVTVEFVGNFAPAVTQRVNSAGEIAGDFQLNAITTAMRYTPALGRTPLAGPAGTTQSIATGINDAGAIVGRYSAASGTFGAMWSPAGALTTLPAPPGSWSYSTPSDISDSGVVCGTATLIQTGTDIEQAWRWTPKSGYQMLPRLGGIAAGCRDINSSGQIAGFSSVAGGAIQACLWQPDGTPLALGVPVGGGQAFARAINDAGTVCGGTVGNDIPWAWSAATGMRTLPDFGFKASAFDINSAGWILGWADTMPFETVPVVWDPDGNLHNIAALVDPNRFYFPGDYIVPIAINDSNLIVVRGYDFTAGGDPMVLMFRIVGPSVCPTDLDGDGQTGPQEITRLLAAWGTAGAGGEDFTGDGVVGPQDITALLSAWGPCP